MNYKYKLTLSKNTYEKYKRRINNILPNFGTLTIGQRKITIHYSAPKTYDYNTKHHISQAQGGSDWKTVREARVEDAITKSKYDAEFWQ